MTRYFTATGIVLLWFIGSCAIAAPTDRYEEMTGEHDDFDVIEKPWQESDAQVPDLPADDEWVTLPMDSLPKTQMLALSKNHIVIDKKDLVVRYWLLIRSTGGAYNAMYQGLRCRTREVINYAYGQQHRDPMVVEVKEPKWMDIGKRGRGNYAHELSTDIFCSGEVPRNARQVEQAMAGVYGIANPYQDLIDNDR